MRYFFRIFAVILAIFLIPFTGIADIYNPKPYDNDFVLPMPDGAKMVFRPVFIGEGSQPYALKEFKVGDRSAGGFKEYPTDVVIGGSFIKNNSNGKSDWLYYIGKYEVTEAQYYSIMEPGTKNNSRKPVANISWFDAQEFINKYNMWLFDNSADQLPKNENSAGFLRLPTEIEWEFAARGGNEVNAAHFDKKHPYTKRLMKHEWYNGPESSHGKVKKTGLLKPNKLKIHDMLGNVAEMTNSFYRIEYYQGRMGGFVSRGGHYLTKKSKLRSSQREEIPLYKPMRGKIMPTTQSTLGFRLVIASQIYTSRQTLKTLESEWPDYVKSVRVTPAARPTQTNLPLASRTDVRIDDARQSLERLMTELNALPNPPQGAMDQIGLLNASFQNIEATVKKAESDSAYAWTKIASETIYLIYSRDMKEIPRKRKALKASEGLGKTGLVDKIRKQIQQKEKNIEEAMASYGLAFTQLEKIRKASVDKSFVRYRDFLSRKGAPAQIRLLSLVKKHYADYRHNRRMNIDKWKTELENF